MTYPKIVIGNWKMNGSRALVTGMRGALAACDHRVVHVVLCPPAPYWLDFAEEAAIGLGAQDIDVPRSGKIGQTGDYSAQMAADCGVRWLVVGHSERRHHYGETDHDVRDKIAVGTAAGLTPILCVGEGAEIRALGAEAACDFVKKQIHACLPLGFTGPDLILAYEPVWAVGTGQVAKAVDIETMLCALRAFITGPLAYTGNLRMVYGGSITPGTASDLWAVRGLDGVMVGGASLKPTDFVEILRMAAGASLKA